MIKIEIDDVKYKNFFQNIYDKYGKPTHEQCLKANEILKKELGLPLDAFSADSQESFLRELASHQRRENQTA